MSYKTIYIIPFKSRDKHSYEVEIQKKDYNGSAKTLTASGNSPFVVSIDDERFLYTPMRLSTASIRIVGSDYLQELYSTDYQQFRVTLLCDNVVTWCGFVKPEVYTQEYTSMVFELELECVSSLLSLDNISYSKKNTDALDFVSLFDLVKRAISASNGRYQSVFLPHVYAKSKSDFSASANVLSSMTLSEQNLFDEDKNPMKWSGVIEEICKFLNWTCCDWCGSLYFLDADHKGQYRQYSPDFNSYTYVSFNELRVNDIGFSGANHTLEIIGGYNKATVKCSNYSIGDVFPVEEFSSLTRLGDKIVHAREYVEGDKVARKVYFFPRAYKMYHYEHGTIQNEVSEEAIKSMSLDDVDKLLGAIPVKRCNYEMKNINGTWQPNITNYNYDDLIQIRSVLYPATEPSNKPDYELKRNKPILTFSEDLPLAVYKDGAFAIQGSVQLIRAVSNNVERYEPISEMYSFGEDLPTIFGQPYLVCRLSIGNMYWDGVSFVNIPSTFKVYISDGKEDQFEHPVSGNFLNIKSTKTLNMPYDGLDGYIIPIGAMLSGRLEFSIRSFRASMFYGAMNCFLKGLKCVFQQMDGYLTEDESDRIYENVPNEHYINELDEITMKISSYNNDCASYGKVLLGDNYLTNNLYSFILDKEIRLEEQLLNRIIKQYQATKISLTQIIKNDDRITPLTLMTDKHMSGKKFIIVGGEIDYCADSFECKMIELYDRD